MTVYPYYKLNPDRCIDSRKKWRVERTWVNSSADWGSSDPLSLVQVARHMKAKGFTEQQVTRLQGELDRLDAIERTLAGQRERLWASSTDSTSSPAASAT